MAKEVPLSVKLSLRAVLLSRQGGVKQTCIEKDYFTLTNSKLVVKDYGFTDLYEFLLALPDIVRLQYSVKDGENKVFGVVDKDVFTSVHAKKAQGIPNGQPPLPPSQWPRNLTKTNHVRERKVPADKSSFKVTVQNENSGKMVIPRDRRGMYALHINNLPLNCAQAEVNKIFKRYPTYREVKIEGSATNRFCFVRFSQHGDAAKALKELDGFNLQGSKLRIKPAIENKGATNYVIGVTSKDKGPCKSEVKKDENLVKGAGVMDSRNINGAISPGSNVQSGRNEPQVALSLENWEMDSHPLSPRRQAEGNKTGVHEEMLVEKEDGCYPIHVSNFPFVTTTKESLEQLFRRCGHISKVTFKEKFAFIYFTTQEAAIMALRTMKGFMLGGRKLTVTPKNTTFRIEKDNMFSWPGGSSRLSHGSSHSSVSSCDSPTFKTPTPLHTPDTGYGSGDNYNGLAQSDSDVPSNVPKNTITSYADLSNKQTKTELESKEDSSRETNLAAEMTVPVSGKPVAPVHMLLSFKEMIELMRRCGKVMRTSGNIAPHDEELDILVTEVVDSCHFWANVDDKIGSYKELEQIRSDLQIVEHHKRCMPLQYDLGAALYSEDNFWYRCWCLEVSSIEKRQAKVFFVDYGNCEWISWDNFTDIHKRFWDLAPQAVPFKLAGLEPTSKLSAEVSKEGATYLSSLICNTVCKARRTQVSDHTKSHVIEVELLLKDSNSSSVNKQMSLTRYVDEPQNVPMVPHQQLLRPVQEMNLQTTQLLVAQQLHPALPLLQTQHTLPSQQPITTKDAGSSHAVVQIPTQQAVQTLQPTQQAVQTSQFTQQAVQVSQPTQQAVRTSQAFQKPVQNEQSKPNQKHQPPWQSKQAEVTQQQYQTFTKPLQSQQAIKNQEKVVQSQQSLPAQLYEKKEVLSIKLSEVISPDEIYFQLDDEKTSETFARLKRLLKDDVNPMAKIYPKVGNVVVKILEDKRRFRAKIESIPGRSGGFGVDKVTVSNVDFGKTECVPLSMLCELPASLKDVPFQAMRCKMAGIRRKLTFWPGSAIRHLIELKRLREPIKASVLERRKDGVLLVELFDSAGRSLNVQIVKDGYGLLDEHRASVPPASVTSPPSVSSNSSESLSVAVSEPATNQKPWWHLSSPATNVLEGHVSDIQSIASDWEDYVQEEDWDEKPAQMTTPLTSGHKVSTEKLYVPPPPEMRPISAVLSGGIDSLDSFTEPIVNYDAGTEQEQVSDKETCVDETVFPQFVESEEARKEVVSGTKEDLLAWKTEREELIQKDEELQHILDKSRDEVKKILQLEQEKEKLERKIRIKEMENHILKLQKELKQLESNKDILEQELK